MPGFMALLYPHWITLVDYHLDDRWMIDATFSGYCYNRINTAEEKFHSYIPMCPGITTENSPQRSFGDFGAGEALQVAAVSNWFKKHPGP